MSGDPIRTALAELVRLRDATPFIVDSNEGASAWAAARAALAEQPSVREPLTDEQITDILGGVIGGVTAPSEQQIAFSRAIERAHGIGVKGEA